MNPSATSTRNLEIEGMSGDKCVGAVQGALQGVPNVTTKSVRVGGATIDADSAGCSAACSALGAAGYQTKEATSQGQRTGASGQSGQERVDDASSQPRTGRMDDASKNQPRHESGDAADSRREATKQESGRPNAAQRG